MKKYFSRFASLLMLFFLASCETNQTIVNNISEREANEILVYLASKGIDAQKALVPSTGAGGAPSNQYMIIVASNRSIDAMAVLNKVGLPRRQGQTLLELFAKSGLMSSTLEETVRYQAGLAEELKNTIRKIDGVIDADVQISFPNTTGGGGAGGAPAPGTPQQKITAAVYVKHQGILEDPNSHIEVKIKRLMAGSVSGLSYDDVAVISDRSRFADITLTPEGEPIGSKALQTHVSIWGLVMTQSSIGRFRIIFFTLIILLLLSFGLIGWLVYRFFPYFRIPFLKKEEPKLPEIPPRG